MKFRPGDEVIVNGTQAVIRSWPADDSGPFNYEMAAPGGGRTSAVGWINPDMGLEPAHGGYDVRLVHRPARPPQRFSLTEKLWLDSLGPDGPATVPPGYEDFADPEFETPPDERLAEDATDDEWLAFISRNDSDGTAGRNE